MNHQSLAWSRGSQEARRVAASTRYVYEKTLSVAGTYDLMSIADDKGRRINPKGFNYKILSMTIIGGGGGGGGGADSWSGSGFGAGGGGGGSGYYTQISNVKINKPASLSIIVGTGGAGGPASTQIQNPSYAVYGGKSGGNTQVIINSIISYDVGAGSGGYPGMSRNPEPYPYQGAGGSGWNKGSGNNYGDSSGGAGGISFSPPWGNGGKGGTGCGWNPSGRSGGASGTNGYCYIKIEYYM